MATEQTTPASDRMTFYDDYKTPLAAGSYRFVLQQTVTVGGDEPRNYYRDQLFEVQGPRYTIEGSEIQAYFPPPGGVADYRTILPHLVLRARSLPWERTIWPGEKREPWLALLVLSEQDLLEGKAVVKTGKVADLVPEKTTDTSASRTEGGVPILLPKFIREEDPQTPVRLLDLNLDRFLELCPRREDLPLLAHVRRVDTTDKVPLEMAADGEFSVLVANRFPPLGASTIHLISLEGWKDLIGATAAAFLPISRVRLITLASWTFVNNPAGHDTFGGLMQRLRNNTGVLGVATTAHAGDVPAPPHEAYVNQALERGYVPVDYQPLESTATFAWYRGPLSPLERPLLNQPPFRRADAALIFDENTAIMDVSYASAWQLGRLLALASPAFSKGLRLFVERRQNATEFARQIKAFVELHRGAFSGPPGEQIAIADELLEWIGRLVMLYPVPFHYLVPHQALLPPDSLRFFHLDNNWIDALVDGALSIAVRNLVDQGVASRADLQSALSKIVYQYRLRLQGREPQANPSEGYMTSPKSGFLLRSSIVSGWPGVEVTVETDVTSDGTIPEILRLDQISDGVLFCLARGCVKKVTFREPREGITFGVDTDNTGGQKLQRADARDGVADIAAIGGRLGKPNIGSAEFAVQMIRKPEEQDIVWG